jgi:glutathione peroxidase
LTDLYGFTVETIDGNSTTLDRYRGQPLLIVNVASRCGFTPQYEGLEALYRKYNDRGLVVLGFPCNQFGKQEPGSEAEIRSFCDEYYGVTFPLFAKIDVNGPNAHPLYRHLKSAKRGLLGRETIAWNFTKFLAGRNGEVLRRYGPRRKPEAIEKDSAGLV